MIFSPAVGFSELNASEIWMLGTEVAQMTVSLEHLRASLYGASLQ